MLNIHATYDSIPVGVKGRMKTKALVGFNMNCVRHSKYIEGKEGEKERERAERGTG